MLDINNANTERTKEEIQGIKQDIQSLITRLSNIQHNAGGLLVEQLEDLSTTITDLKEKAVDTGRNNLADLYVSTRRHPLRNLVYAFGVGVILSYLIKR